MTKITGVPDRVKLVAEIWLEENLVAELNQESDKLEIKLYPSQHLVFELDDFLSAVQTAKDKLPG